VKRIDKLGVAGRVHNARAAVAMELDNQHNIGIAGKLHVAIGGEVISMSGLHRFSLLCFPFFGSGLSIVAQMAVRPPSTASFAL
jgi:hypothetical protein